MMGRWAERRRKTRRGPTARSDDVEVYLSVCPGPCLTTPSLTAAATRKAIIRLKSSRELTTPSLLFSLFPFYRLPFPSCLLEEGVVGGDAGVAEMRGMWGGRERERGDADVGIWEVEMMMVMVG